MSFVSCAAYLDALNRHPAKGADECAVVAEKGDGLDVHAARRSGKSAVESGTLALCAICSNDWTRHAGT